MEWGNVPAWLALIGGLTAAFAFTAGRLDARRLLASQVFAVLTSFRLGVDRQTGTYGHVNVKPTNYGNAPIFDVGISVHQRGRRRWFWRLRGRADWWTGAPVRGGGRLWSTILPESEGEVAELPAPDASRDADRTNPPVIMTFRDGNGRRWVRWPDGKLTSGWLTKQP